MFKKDSIFFNTSYSFDPKDEKKDEKIPLGSCEQFQKVSELKFSLKYQHRKIKKN